VCAEDLMAKIDLERRVENIEETLTLLNTMPARMGGLEARVGNLETQFLQFRQEVRLEFSAVRTEMKALNDDAKAHARVLHEDLIERIKTLVKG
jgi:hypothetical protein